MAVPFRVVSNERRHHRDTAIQSLKADVDTPKTAPRPVVRSTPQTAVKAFGRAGKENHEHVTKSDLFESDPYLLRSIAPDEEPPALTVVLDLDETLVNNRRLDLPAAILRSYAAEALQALRQLPGVEVVMWTASTEDTAAPVVRQLSAQGKVFDDIIFRNDAWFTEPYHTKDLRLLGRSMDRVVLFDNSPNCCKTHKSNCVLVEDFSGYHNMADNTLINLYRIVEVLVRDVRGGSTVPEILHSLAEEKAICRRISYELPEAWRHVNIAKLHPLSVPPFGTFFKVPITDF